MGLAVACFVTPGPFIGLGIIGLLDRPASSWCTWLYNDTLFAPWLALTLRAFPFAYLIVWHGLRSVPRQVVESAPLDGANRIATFWYVVLPQLLPCATCAVLVSLAIAVADLSASVLVIPPGVTTVASRIFKLGALRRGRSAGRLVFDGGGHDGDPSHAGAACIRFHASWRVGMNAARVPIMEAR